MKDEFEMFDKLAPELKTEIAKNLSNCDLVNLAQTSEYHLSLFKPMVDVRKLLHNVVRGKHDAVQSMLRKDISLIFARSKVTDCSGRTFDNVSAFEYALWALDKHMWSAMVECIPLNEEGRKIIAQLIAQYNKINTNGVTYRLNGKRVTEQHFDFKNTIIKELQIQVDLINAPGAKNVDAINKQWREGVGGVQKLLPMHVIDEYCSNEPFYPVPQFITQPKSLKKIYNWTMIIEKEEHWFSIDSKLGVNFAIYKGPAQQANGLSSCGGPWHKFSDDLEAMTALCKVRTTDFINLKSQLEEQINLDNRYQVFQI
ncbi:TPA: F-box protein [Legionella pneumophila]|uniref:SidC homolog n=1 Tax=Legionella pneumophila subsp. pneumophila TaxID=91891 RepID=A0AAV2UXW7_LEGPN|nr:hypothetical protein [Legionella pneumophila]CCD05911.1 conserved protein of unknown function [Legionella pneumophila subsp. pneumophila]MCZ4805154.1 F-box protein [Legionella pneumophila]MDW8854676.1 F-box protein [Legionella pneumophila]MDW8867370.1 F-box protein [Legionella pneumophila]MDW8922008.1 F-box protein [Legionella pneumophila]